MPTNANQACTVSRQATGDTTNLPNIQYAARFQRNSGQTGTGTLNPSYNLETADSVPYAGKQITLSFYARAGANFSQASNALGVIAVIGTGTDQNLQNGYTGQSGIINSTATLTTTWQRFTFTTAAAISSSTSQIGFYFPWQPTGTAGAADYFEITGIMINVGTTALPYRRNAGTIQGELAACQRYYFRYTQNAAYQPYGTGFNYSATQSNQVITLPVTMRTTPSLGFSAANQFAIQHGAAVTTLTTIGADRLAPDKVSVACGVSSGLTTGQGSILSGQTGTTAYVEASAEL
jgi:hypothetical protein